MTGQELLLSFAKIPSVSRINSLRNLLRSGFERSSYRRLSLTKILCGALAVWLREGFG